MATHIIRQVWSAISNLNPQDVRVASEQSVLIGLHAKSEESFDLMDDFFSPPHLSRERRLEVFKYLYRVGDKGAPAHFDIEIFEAGMPHPAGTFVFRPNAPHQVVEDILAVKDSLGLPLARVFLPFREPVIEKIIHTIAKENALFSLATALPDIVPSLIELPWAVGQFASDTAFLTVNQTRMAFLIAAASDRLVGYSEQRNQIGSILASAFGWRALARELVGKIPFGGGLIPKAAIAYAGTYVAGKTLERYYRDGYKFTRGERRDRYEDALEMGKRVAADILQVLGIGKNKGGEASRQAAPPA